MFGCGIFGDIIFADLYNMGGPGPGVGARGIGGSGFPPNWEAILARNATDDEREKRRLEEALMLARLAGLL